MLGWNCGSLVWFLGGVGLSDYAMKSSIYYVH